MGQPYIDPHDLHSGWEVVVNFIVTSILYRYMRLNLSRPNRSLSPSESPASPVPTARGVTESDPPSGATRHVVRPAKWVLALVGSG